MTQRLVTLQGIKQLDSLKRWIRDDLDACLEEPSVWKPVIRAVGRQIEWNFDSEGDALGHTWQRLSAVTRDLRQSRGYPPSHPILEQSGQLRYAASSPFLKWQVHQRRSVRSLGAPYHRTGRGQLGQSGPLQMNAAISGKEFHAQISGTRVENQYGKALSGTRVGTRGRNRKRILPARPFWILTQESVDEGASDMGQALLNAWGKKAKGLKVL